MEVDLHLSHGRFVKVALVSCGTLTFTEDEVCNDFAILCSLLYFHDFFSDSDLLMLADRAVTEFPRNVSKHYFK